MPKKSIHETAVVLSAVDRMSGILNRAFNNADRRLTAFQKRADKVAKTSANIGRKAGQIGSVVAAPLALATKKAVEFEDSMADVSKVLNLKQGSEELAAMATQSQDLAVHLAKTPKAAAEMIAALAQGGTAKKELFQIGKFTGEMSVAFDIMASRAGDAFTKTKNALGATTAETMRTMDAINHLSDNSAAKASQILDFMASGGAGVARALKLSGQESASLGAFFIAMGKSGSEAATIVERLSKGLQKNTKIGKLFRDSGGGMQGLLKVLEVGNNLSGTQRFEFFSKFGQYGADIALAASNMQQLQKTTGLVANQSAFANSVGSEFANRSNTRAFELRKLQAQTETLAIKLGNALLPVISELATAITPVLTRLAMWMEKNPELTSQIVKGIAMFAAMNLAISGLSFAVSGVASTFSFFAKGLLTATRLGRVFSLFLAKPTLMLKRFAPILLRVGKLIRMVGIAFRFLTVAMMANPIIAIITGIAVAAFLIYRNWGGIKEFFAKVWNGLVEAVKSAFSFIKNIGSMFFNAGANIATSIANGIKARAIKAVQAIKNVAKQIRSYLPFSPAKQGALRDIHRIRLVETIAKTITPAPAIAAMRRTVNAIANVGFSGSPNPSLQASGTNGITINFNPSISVNGASKNVKNDIVEALREHSTELLNMIEEAQALKNRRKF